MTPACRLDRKTADATKRAGLLSRFRASLWRHPGQCPVADRRRKGLDDAATLDMRNSGGHGRPARRGGGLRRFRLWLAPKRSTIVAGYVEPHCILAVGLGSHGFRRWVRPCPSRDAVAAELDRLGAVAALATWGRRRFTRQRPKMRVGSCRGPGTVPRLGTREVAAPEDCNERADGSRGLHRGLGGSVTPRHWTKLRRSKSTPTPTPAVFPSSFPPPRARAAVPAEPDKSSLARQSEAAKSRRGQATRCQGRAARHKGGRNLCQPLRPRASPWPLRPKSGACRARLPGWDSALRRRCGHLWGRHLGWFRPAGALGLGVRSSRPRESASGL